MSLIKLVAALKGGPGSGNFGHSGRPGVVGGSTPGVYAGPMEFKVVDEKRSEQVAEENDAYYPNACYSNAMKVAEANPDLTYVEGIAVQKVRGREPEFADHAWLIDKNGNVVDPSYHNKFTNEKAVYYAQHVFSKSDITTLRDAGLLHDNNDLKRFKKLPAVGLKPQIEWRSLFDKLYDKYM